MKARLIYFFILLYKVNSLIPSKNNRKKFKFNYKSPSNDLKVIEQKQAFLISKNWLDNITLYILNKNKQKNIKKCDEIFYITNINEFRKIIKDENEYIYLSWMPDGLYGINEILYMIILHKINNILIIKYVLQSPYWNSSQITSNKLKLSLIQYSKSNKLNISFDELYKNDLRHKLSWSIWDL